MQGVRGGTLVKKGTIRMPMDYKKKKKCGSVFRKIEGKLKVSGIKK